MNYFAAGGSLRSPTPYMAALSASGEDIEGRVCHTPLSVALMVGVDVEVDEVGPRF